MTLPRRIVLVRPRDPLTLTGRADIDANAATMLEAVRASGWMPHRWTMNADRTEFGLLWFCVGGYSTILADEDGDGWAALCSNRMSESVYCSGVSDPALLPSLIADLRLRHEMIETTNGMAIRRLS